MFLAVADANASGIYEILLNPFIGKQRQMIDFEFNTCAGDAPMTTEDLSSFTPIWQNERSEAGFMAAGRLTDVGDDVVLPSTGGTLPQTFAKLDFGPTFRHRFPNRWILGANASAGSSSDRPFSSYNTLEIMGNLSLLIPSKDKGAWVFFLNYSNNRDFWRHVPLPGFGYAFNESWGQGFVGIPALTINLLPRSKIDFNLRYFPVIRLYSDIGWNISETKRLAVFFEWGDDHYWRSGRQYDNRQIFFVGKNMGSSLRLKLYKDINMNINAGWRFNRYIFEGRSILKDTDYNRINLESAPFAGFELSAKM